MNRISFACCLFGIFVFLPSQSFAEFKLVEVESEYWPDDTDTVVETQEVCLEITGTCVEIKKRERTVRKEGRVCIGTNCPPRKVWKEIEPEWGTAAVGWSTLIRMVPCREIREKIFRVIPESYMIKEICGDHYGKASGLLFVEYPHADHCSTGPRVDFFNGRDLKDAWPYEASPNRDEDERIKTYEQAWRYLKKHIAIPYGPFSYSDMSQFVESLSSFHTEDRKRIRRQLSSLDWDTSPSVEILMEGKGEIRYEFSYSDELATEDGVWSQNPAEWRQKVHQETALARADIETIKSDFSNYVLVANYGAGHPCHIN